MFPDPPTYLAPRLFDTGDYVGSPGSTVGTIDLFDADGGTTLGGVVVATSNMALTASGAPVPFLDRQDAGFLTAEDLSGDEQPPVICWETQTGSQLCLTEGMAQKGVTNDESFVVTFEGIVKPFAALACQLVGNVLEFGNAYLGDITQIGLGVDGGGILVREAPNLDIELSENGTICGEYTVGDGGVSANGIDLVLQSGPGCPAGPQLLLSIFAGGQKPYTVEGSTTGFVNELWPADGTLHFVPGHRWHYPADLIRMEYRAQQLVDLVNGRVAAPLAPDSGLPYPTSVDYQALDTEFGLAVYGILGTSDGGAALPDGGELLVPERGGNWAFSQSSGVYPLTVTTLDLSSYIEGLIAYTAVDDGGYPNLWGTYRGGSTLIHLDPDLATSAAISEVH